MNLDELKKDDICGNRPCCNPEHLEAVNSSENKRRIKKRKNCE